MSPREAIQTALAEFLKANRGVFTAPYGVIPGLNQAGKGKVRTVFFGVARYLDATAYIWSADRIELWCEGPLVTRLGSRSRFSSLEGLKAHLRECFTGLKEAQGGQSTRLARLGGAGSSAVSS